MRSRTLSNGRSVKVRDNGGLKKRCGCARRQWSKCAHPWHFGFAHDGEEHRWSLHRVANKPRGYWMSKSEAEAIRDRLRAQIREGTMSDIAAPRPDARLTFGDIADRYLERHVRVPTRRPRAVQQAVSHLRMLRGAEVSGPSGGGVLLAEKRIDLITKADVESIRESRRRHPERPGVKGGEVGINRLLARLRHLFSWAIAEGYVNETPFKRNGVTVVKLETRVETPRHRRLEPGEEAKLLQNAGDHLRALIVALLSTGCRVGELLSLQWKQVRRDDAGIRRWLMLSPTNTKTYKLRAIPVGARLRAELGMREHGPDATAFGPEAFVFGNAVGEKISSVKTAWRATCRRAHIADLQIRDLRREFGSRLRESGASDHDVRDFLGHANITTTSRYLASTPQRLAQALANLESGNRRTSVVTNSGSDVGDESPGPARRTEFVRL
jgi:integrase